MGARDKHIKKFKETKRKYKALDKSDANDEIYHRFVVHNGVPHPENQGLLSYAYNEYHAYTYTDHVQTEFDGFIDYFNHYVYAPKRPIKYLPGHFWYNDNRPEIIDRMNEFGVFLGRLGVRWSHIRTDCMENIWYSDYVQTIGRCNRRKWEIVS
ncbi:MAG: hypothetical protein ACW99G_19605 [Candidatus Thorarchaeota archaeon]|jgi:hypothetical protein